MTDRDVIRQGDAEVRHKLMRIAREGETYLDAFRRIYDAYRLAPAPDADEEKAARELVEQFRPSVVGGVEIVESDKLVALLARALARARAEGERRALERAADECEAHAATWAAPREGHLAPSPNRRHRSEACAELAARIRALAGEGADG